MIYSYRCANGHEFDRIRRIANRDEAATCGECDHPARRVMHTTHIAPDGVYSYAPNIGDPDRFERQRAAIDERKKEGGRQRVIARAPSKGDLERWGNG